jgi:carbonic anhydrase/acetyltransferase-like protein (isoleucine patch superfamily)
VPIFRHDEPEIDVVKPIKVGNNVFIGYGSVILPGVSIGDNVVIGARSVVTRDIPSNCVAAGAPCKVIKSIFDYKISTHARADPTKLLSPRDKYLYYINKYHNLQISIYLLFEW